MATRTVLLTPAEVRACVADRAANEIRNRTRYLGRDIEPEKIYDESVEFVTTADGTAALVVFIDKDAPRPASMPPIAFGTEKKS